MLYNKDGSIWGGTGGAYRPSGVKASMNLQLELDVIAKNCSTPTARDHFGEYNLDKLVRKDGKSRLDQLGNQVRYTEEDVEKCRQLQSKNWPTPAARDWKDTTSTIPPCTGVTRGMTLTNAIVDEQNKSDNVGNTTPALKYWGTPTHRDYKGSYPLHGLIRKDGKSRLDQLVNQFHYTEEDVEKCRQLQSKNWPTPTAREWKIESLEVYVRRSVKRIQKEAKNWPTPPASQRGEDLEVYIRNSIDRVKKGGAKFAPTLQVAVEAEDKRIEIDNFKKHNINIEDDTEIIVRSIMEDFYKKDSQNTKDNK